MCQLKSSRTFRSFWNTEMSYGIYVFWNQFLNWQLNVGWNSEQSHIKSKNVYAVSLN